VTDNGAVQLRFAVDEKLPTKAGKVATKVTVDGKRVARLVRAGRHGKDFVYTARVASGGLEVGSKYRVRFAFEDGTVTRTAKLIATRA
jgi:hypothetical protein